MIVKWKAGATWANFDPSHGHRSWAMLEKYGLIQSARLLDRRGPPVERRAHEFAAHARRLADRVKIYS